MAQPRGQSYAYEATVRSWRLSYHIFHLLTHFGDSALLIPLSLAAIGILLWSDHRATALRFATTVAVVMAATVILKVGFYSVGGDTYLNVLSPSGHAGFSVTVYGCVAAVLAKQLRIAGATIVVAATTILLATVLESRIVIHAHTPEEVVMGSVLGFVCVAAFVVSNSDMKRLRIRLSLPAVIALVIGSLAVWQEGRRFNTERRIEEVGVLVGSSLGTLSPFRPTIHGPHSPSESATPAGENPI